MKDTPADTGVEPNPDAGPMWVTQDIWVRNEPIPGYQPQPFAADPAWLTAISPLHQNPEYRDPKGSHPNYIYVRVRNRGSTPSSGTERLRVYWAKASTGLSWPSQWVDYTASTCGPSKLYGMEVTKPRRNVADLTVPQSEVDKYRDAIIAVGTMASYQFPDGMQYWHKQQQVHAHVVNFTSGTFAAHGSDGFLPWHREFINRYEVLLREAYPTVTLFYYDWHMNPATNARVTGLMGSFSGAIGAPFNVLAPPSVSRVTGTHPSAPNPTSVADATVTGQATFVGHRAQSENPHNTTHVYVGGSSGNLTSPSVAAQDPFFFFIHANVDRLWSMWQRGNPSRYTPATAYTGTGADMTQPMAPWNGLRSNGSVASGGNPAHTISPWTAAGGYILLKPANDDSVVFPPIYDTALLSVPPLAAGQSVVIEIPWYPPNPADFACFGADQGHVCLVARIETSSTAPFGMTVAETSSISDNTRNNNNIVWKNVTVVDSFPGFLLAAPIWLRNVFPNATVPVRLDLRLPVGAAAIFDFGAVELDLGQELFARWEQAGGKGQGVERVGGTRVQMFGTNASVFDIPLFPDEVQRVEVQLRLNPQYPNPDGRTYAVDLEQRGSPTKTDELVGGQRFEFNFNKLVMVAKNATWHYLDTGEYPGQDWFFQGYDDSKWRVGAAELGYGDGDEASIIRGGPPGARHITSWFRRAFALSDPSLYRNLWLNLKVDDGAIVYLNGTEVARLRMPNGPVNEKTLGNRVNGLAEEICYPIDLSRFTELLRSNNVVAVEVHQSAPDDDDLSFALELAGNLSSTQFPPVAKFQTPPDGSLHLLGDPIPFAAAALDPDGVLTKVDFSANGQFLGSAVSPPYAVTWNNAPAGQHLVNAIATDNDGLTGTASITVQVLSNLPPIIAITSPVHDSMFMPGEPIPVSATASDRGGSIQRVDFFWKAHEPTFNEPEMAAGSRTAEPFSVTLSNLPPGHHFVWAVATDNEGATSAAQPIMIHVEAAEEPMLFIRLEGTEVVIEWMPHGAILEEAPTVAGPWTPRPNLHPPRRVTPIPGQSMFYRVHLP